MIMTHLAWVLSSAACPLSFDNKIFPNISCLNRVLTAGGSECQPGNLASAVLREQEQKSKELLIRLSCTKVRQDGEMTMNVLYIKLRSHFSFFRIKLAHFRDLGKRSVNIVNAFL